MFVLASIVEAIFRFLCGQFIVTQYILELNSYFIGFY
jgi:hypothetical protein